MINTECEHNGKNLSQVSMWPIDSVRFPFTIYHLPFYVPPVLNSSDDEDDEDYVPLGNILKKLKGEKTSERTAGQSLSSEAPQTQHEGRWS